MLEHMHLDTVLGDEPTHVDLLCLSHSVDACYCLQISLWIPAGDISIRNTQPVLFMLEVKHLQCIQKSMYIVDTNVAQFFFRTLNQT
jgi:hypothetical protein